MNHSRGFTRLIEYVKPMKGKLRDVIEMSVTDDSDDQTFRMTCTTKLGDVVYVVYVLH